MTLPKKLEVTNLGNGEIRTIPGIVEVGHEKGRRGKDITVVRFKGPRGGVLVRRFDTKKFSVATP
ncbi:MAG: hypothetical protein PHU42_00215 [Patescibacteria group bacterium]|nr:hypothetical protein [Patescibacteria group bacterium]